MNEEYLRGFKRSPDPGMIERIHARVEKRERTHKIRRFSLLSVLVLTFIFGMLITFSSHVRADMITILMKIGGVQYHVSSEYPSAPAIEVVELEPEYVSWEEAKIRFISPLQLPTYVPEGYQQEEHTHFYR